MENIDQTYLFYDKCANNIHSFNNPLTTKYTIDNIFKKNIIPKRK